MGPHVRSQPVSVRVCTGLSSELLGDRAVAPKFIQRDFVDQTRRHLSFRIHSRLMGSCQPAIHDTV